MQTALRNLGYDPGAYEGFLHQSNSTKGIFKLDWNIDDSNRLAFIYNFLRASKDNPAHPTALGFRGPNASVLQFENAGYEINNNIDSFLLELNSNLSANMSNKLQVGYTQFDDFRNPFSTPAPSITILDGSGSNYIIAGHEPFFIHNQLDQQVIQITNNLNILMNFDSTDNQIPEEQQRAGLESYKQQDDYLNSRRGQYAERYGALAPWRRKWDMKLLQDFKFRLGGKKIHTVQFSVDMLNVGNFINSDWVVIQQPTSVQPIGINTADPANPTYTFDPNTIRGNICLRFLFTIKMAGAVWSEIYFLRLIAKNQKILFTQKHTQFIRVCFFLIKHLYFSIFILIPKGIIR